MTTQTTIALGKLVPGQANVRRKAGTAIAELAASIAAHGLIQNLVVREAGKGGKYEVIAGGRRLAALRLLMKEKRAVGGVAVTKSYPVRVVVSEADRDVEISLAENTQREAMHVVDEVLAYRQLAEDGMATEDIAARFGQSVVTVRQRLKLAHLSPRILDVLREDGMSLEQAKALAVSDDHAGQEAAWFEQSDWNRAPHHLRAVLTQAHVRATDRLARFVGLEAYEAAGGAVLRDLFAEDGGTFLIDRPLLARLAQERLQAVADELRGQGWGWAEVSLEPGLAAVDGLSRIYPERRGYTEAEEAELAELSEQYDALQEQVEGYEEGDPAIEADEARLAEVEAKVSAIQNGTVTFAPEIKALAGCVVGIGYDGAVSVTCGLVRPDDRKALLALQAGDEGEREVGTDIAAPDDEGRPSGLSAALTEELTAIKTAALRVELAGQPRVALCALLHPLASALFHAYRLAAGASSAVEIRGERKNLEPCIKEPDACPALTAWRGVMDGWGERLPGDPASLWPWLLAQDIDTLLDLLAAVTAANLNAVTARYDARTGRLAQAGHVAAAVGLDMGRWWTPGLAFLARISKADITEVMREAGCNPDACRAVEKAAKADAVALAEKALVGKGWLPQVFRPISAAEPANVPEHLNENRADIAA